MTREVTHPGPIVVLVLSHRDPPLVRRLVGRLTEGSDLLVGIHHDPSGPPLDLAPSSNVALVPHPIHCEWGSYELVRATWQCLHWAARTVPELSWVLLISGQDYPAMPLRRLEEELHSTPHDAFLRHFRIDDDPASDVHPWQQLCRTRYFHRRRVPLLPRSVPWPRRHPFHNGKHAYAGDMWFNISARAMHNMLDSAFAPSLLQFLEAAPIPDEMFIASMVCNDSSLDVVNDRRRYVRFDRGARHPHPISTGDLPEIATSGAFFARKVSIDAPDVLDRLDAVTGNLPGSATER